MDFDARRVPKPGTLPAPKCNAGTIDVRNNSQLVLAHIEPTPGPGSGRENMVLRASYDDGATFPYRQMLWAGPAAYVTLTTTEEEGSVGLLYENGVASEKQSCYQRISYQKVPVPVKPPAPPGL